MLTLHGTLLQPRTANECSVSPNTIVRIGNDGRIAEVYVGLDHDAAEIQSDLASLIP